MNAVHGRRRITTLITGGDSGAEEMVLWWSIQKPVERVLLVPPKSRSYMDRILRYKEIFGKYPVGGVVVFPGLGGGSYEHLEKLAAEYQMSWKNTADKFPWFIVFIALALWAQSNGVVLEFYMALGCLMLISTALAIWIDKRAKLKARIKLAEEEAKTKIAAQKVYELYENNPHLLNDQDFRQEFHRHWHWSRIRMEILKDKIAEGLYFCSICGIGPDITDVKMHVDHIKPKSKYPELMYLKSNLQILCASCNSSKSDYDGDDWAEVVRARYQQRQRSG